MNGCIKRASEEYKVTWEEQNGFRADRRGGGEDNIYIIRELIDWHKKERKHLYLAFLDIEKVYDKVNRIPLIYFLNKIGFPQKILNLIISMHWFTKSKYIFGDIIAGWVNLERGVKYYSASIQKSWQLEIGTVGWQRRRQKIFRRGQR